MATNPDEACFVFYSDDYADNGGIGLEPFISEQAALDFVASRMSRFKEPKIENYTLIAGRKLPLEVAQRITAVRVKSLTNY